MKNNLLKTEYEATFADIDVEVVRAKIKKLNGKLIKPKFTQKRVVFNLPKGNEIQRGYLRVRDENDKITMSLKVMEANGTIEGQKEVELVIDNYDNGINFLKAIGAEAKAVQETKREIWKIDNVEIMLDWWPFLNPFVEIEGENKIDVKKVSNSLGFNREDAIFDSIDYIYSKKYSISRERITENTPKIIFDMDNPFV